VTSPAGRLRPAPVPILTAALWALLWSAACSPPADGPAVTAPDVRRALHLPAYRGTLEPRFERAIGRRDLVLEWVRIQGRGDQRIPALVCYRRDAPRLPAVLCMPGTPNRKEDLVQPQDLLWRLAGEGFFAISVDRPYHGERSGDPDLAIRRKGLGRVWGEYVYDLSRALDYAQSRPEVDAGRLGMLGLSLGGMEALLLGSLDERLNVAVSVGGQVSWAPVFEAGAWRLLFGGLDLTRQLISNGASGTDALAAFRARMPELEVLDASRVAPLLAPRPLLLMTGEEDPYVGAAAARHTYEAALPAYRAAGAADRLDLWVEPGAGHGFTRAMEERAVAWLLRFM